MIPRYKNKKISEIWSTDNKLKIWLNVELAHLSALNSNIVDKTINQREYETIERIHPVTGKKTPLTQLLQEADFKAVEGQILHKRKERSGGPASRIPM